MVSLKKIWFKIFDKNKYYKEKYDQLQKNKEQIYKKKHTIKPHLHKKRVTKILYTTEVILLLKGMLRVDFYNTLKKYLFSKILKKKDIIMLVHGGHGFKVLRDVEMLEIKQGPYNLIKDKIKFENINENKIKIKK